MLSIGSVLIEVSTGDRWEVMLVGHLAKDKNSAVARREISPVPAAYKIRNERSREIIVILETDIGRRFTVLSESTSQSDG